MSAERKPSRLFPIQPGHRAELLASSGLIVVCLLAGAKMAETVQQEPGTATPTFFGKEDPPTIRVPQVPDYLAVRPADQPLPQEPIIQAHVRSPILWSIQHPPSDLRTHIKDDLNTPGRSVISITRETSTRSTTVSASIPGTTEEIRNHTREINWTTAINIQARHEKRSPFGNTLIAAVDCTTNSLNGRNFQEVSGEYSGNQFNTENQTLYRLSGQLPSGIRNYQTDQANQAAETTTFILSNLS